MVLRQPPSGKHRQLLVHHHAGPHVVLAQLRHLHAKAAAALALGPLHPVTVGTQELPVPDLVLTVVADRQDVIQLEPQVVRQVDATARADASLNGVETAPYFLRDLAPTVKR